MRDDWTKTVCITGGHLTPALALIDEIEENKLPWKILFIGRMFAKEGDKTLSAEYTIISSRLIRFLHLTTGRLSRFVSIRSIGSVCKIPFGFIQSLYYVVRYKPTIIVSFGGYIALPVVVAGWLCRIPTVTHEQTRTVGLANGIISYFAQRVFVSHKDMVQHISKKGMYIGLPLRKQLFEHVKKPSYIPESNKQILYITGGATGAASLNDLVFPVIDNLAKDFVIIHQTGHESYQKAIRTKETMSKHVNTHYVPKEYIDASGVGWILKHATLVVGRSGANTVAEVEALGNVALFIPLPWSGSREQYINAQYLAKKGSAIVLSQADLTPDRLETHIRSVLTRYNEYKQAANKLAKLYPRDGASKMLVEIQNIIH